MARTLEDVHQRGEPVALLTASEGGIYGRFGFGVSGLGANIEVTKEGAEVVVASEGSVELMEVAEARASPSTAALRARSYGVDGELVIGVTDPLCPWNDGVFKLQGGPDGADCAPAGASSAARAPRPHRLLRLERGEDGLGQAAGRRGIEFDRDAAGRVGRGADIDAQGVLGRRVLGMVEVDDGAVDTEPAVRGEAAAFDRGRVGHVGAHGSGYFP